jgi:hypothetical protein
MSFLSGPGFGSHLDSNSATSLRRAGDQRARANCAEMAERAPWQMDQALDMSRTCDPLEAIVTTS